MRRGFPYCTQEQGGLLDVDSSERLHLLLYLIRALNLTSKTMKKIHILILGILLGAIPTAFAATTTFSDVSEGSWYYEAVQSLTDLGIIEGYGDGTYQPANNVNRAEMAVMMDRLVDTLRDNACVYEEKIYFEGDQIDDCCYCYDGYIDCMCFGEDGPSELD